VGKTFLSTSRGGKFEDAARPAIDSAAYPYTVRSGYECKPQFISDARGPFGRKVAATQAIRAAIRAEGLVTPIVSVGGAHNFEIAESWLAEGAYDIVGVARQSLADPDWASKIGLGRGDEVRTCEFTLSCEGPDPKHKAGTCLLCDIEDIEQSGVTKTSDAKQRVTAPDWVAGG